MDSLIFEVKKKREFSGLPDSLIDSVLSQKQMARKSDMEKIKLSRAFLRKYFGVFLTNKVLKLKDESILSSHISSKGRDYFSFYNQLFEGNLNFKSIIDLGCGVNGFSYSSFNEIFGEIDYLGIEAVNQLVEKMNLFFEENDYSLAHAINLDLFDFDEIIELIKKTSFPRAILLLQVIDALEGIKKDSSKDLLVKLGEILLPDDVIIISMPMKSISGKNKFEAKRGWLRWFLDENFDVIETIIGNERIFRCKKKI